jgi:hypothetical protein
MRREKDCIVPAYVSWGRDRPPRSGAPMTCSASSADSALRWL